MRSSKAEADRSHALTGDTVEYAGIYATDHSILTLKGVRVKVSINNKCDLAKASNLFYKNSEKGALFFFSSEEDSF